MPITIVAKNKLSVVDPGDTVQTITERSDFSYPVAGGQPSSTAH
jgi:hypothetical protein